MEAALKAFMKAEKALKTGLERLNNAVTKANRTRAADHKVKVNELWLELKRQHDAATEDAEVELQADLGARLEVMHRAMDASTAGYGELLLKDGDADIVATAQDQDGGMVVRHRRGDPESEIPSGDAAAHHGDSAAVRSGDSAVVRLRRGDPESENRGGDAAALGGNTAVRGGDSAVVRHRRGDPESENPGGDAAALGGNTAVLAKT